MAFEVAPSRPSELAPPLFGISRYERDRRQIIGSTELAVARTHGRAVEAAARVRGVEYIGEEVMASLDRLRRHEARSAADDPVVADEYAAVRRAVLYAGLNEVDQFGRTW